MMRRSSRRELNKLRELVHFLLVGRVCCFCHKALSETAEEFVKHGESTGPKFAERLTIHHKDGNHENQAHENKELCHTSCHKSYHRKLRNAQRAQSAQGVDA